MNLNISRSDFYYDIADHMLPQVKRPRRSPAFHSPDLKPSATHARRFKTPLEDMTASGDIISNIVNAFPGHKSRQFLSARTRNPGFDSAEKPNLRGASGKFKNMKACVVCTNKVSRKVWSHEYCGECRLTVCAPTKSRKNDDGEIYNCWLKLHSNPLFIARANKKKVKEDDESVSRTRERTSSTRFAYV